MSSKLIKHILQKEETTNSSIPLFHYLNIVLEKKSRLLLDNVWYFAVFMLTVIVGILVFYRYTENELIPAVVLGTLWLLFWKNSLLKGRILLVIASVFGYVHELLGVQHGYFTYLGGVIGGAPIWLIPGYGAIFWSSYHLWKIFQERYSPKQWFHMVNYFIFATVALLIIADYIMFDMSAQPVGILLKLSLALMLFSNLEGIRLAYFTGFFTVLTEFTGEMLGTWSHPDFSLISLMAGYVFLLWVCITLGDIIKRRKEWGRIEGMSACALTSFYILLLLGIVAV